MQNSRAVIVTGGNPPSKKLLLSKMAKGDFVIGVDKGCNCLYEYGIVPNLILGDFDSAKKEVIEELKKSGANILQFEPEKDYTDTDLGYVKAKELGYSNILLFGATGSRVDHALGNLGILLKSLNDGVRLEIIDDNNRMFLVDKDSRFSGEFGQLISFHALSDTVKSFNITGAKYELKNYDMKLLEPRAICNEFIDSEIVITFDSGIILVIYPTD